MIEVFSFNLTVKSQNMAFPRITKLSTTVAFNL